MLPGYSYNMTDVQAAIGLVQLERLACFQRRRREIVEQYTAAFRDCEALELPVSRPEVDHAWHLYVIRLHHEALSIDRNGFIHALRERNIGTSVHYRPVHLHSYYRDKYNLVPTQFPIALDYSQRAISLPLHAGLSDQDVSDVYEAVLDVAQAYRR
jgi:dTDP-4-amino-4,6-dideoxygalactose transaminase